MTYLSDEEKRLLTLSMAIISLSDIIVGPLVDDTNIAECEATLEHAKEQYDALFAAVNQDDLRNKLASRLDPPENTTIAPELRRRAKEL